MKYQMIKWLNDGQVFIGELQSLEQEDGEVWSRHGRDLKISETSPGWEKGNLGTSCRYCLRTGWAWPINIYNGAGFRFQAATGYQAAWLEGRSYWSLVHPADVQGLRGAVTRRKRKYILNKSTKKNRTTNGNRDEESKEQDGWQGTQTWRQMLTWTKEKKKKENAWNLDRSREK